MSREAFLARQVTPRVYWVGGIDWTLTDFHGYKTDRGSTYNAFLVMAEKVTLIDTVKAPLRDEMMARIASVIDPREIKYIVSNHAEMDHSGSLMEVIEAVKPERVFASANGVKALKAHFHHGYEIQAVGNGETVSLGDRTLQFFETRMIHWPDSMVTFLKEEGVLFSQDAFGMHLATTELFSDENPAEIVRWEAAKYYANIVLPYSGIVGKTLKALMEMKLGIKMIAPDHGPIWRTEEEIVKILGWYQEWVEQKPRRKAVVVFDTMWRSTEKMASAVAEGLKEGGVRVKVLPMFGAHRSDVITEMLDAGAFVVGSCTMNNRIFPTMADVLTYVSGLKPANKVGACFGSFGWSHNAMKELEGYLQGMGVELVAETVKVNYVPTKEDLVRCVELGKKVAAEVAKRTSESE
ncbi:MAG: FprA family A-type flavoprotein [bacterium]|nr:FprA family A-type flavoprotein [bacterium]